MLLQSASRCSAPSACNQGGPTVKHRWAWSGGFGNTFWMNEWISRKPLTSSSFPEDTNPSSITVKSYWHLILHFPTRTSSSCRAPPDPVTHGSWLSLSLLVGHLSLPRYRTLLVAEWPGVTYSEFLLSCPSCLELVWWDNFIFLLEYNCFTMLC